MSSVTQKLVFEVDGRKIKTTASDFKDLDRVLEKTTGSFGKMEKIMALQLASSIKLSSNFNAMAISSKAVVAPMLNLHGILNKINEFSTVNVKTQKGAKKVATQIKNEAKKLAPEIEKMMVAQENYYKALLNSNKEQKKEFKLLGLTKRELFSIEGTRKLLGRGKSAITKQAALGLEQSPLIVGGKSYTPLGGSMKDLEKSGGKISQFKAAGQLLKGNMKNLPNALKKINLGFGSMIKLASKAKLAAAGVFAGLIALGSASPLLQAQMAYVGFQFEQISIIIGDSLVPIFEVLSDGLQAILDLWNSLSPEMQAAIKDVVLLTGVVALLTLGMAALNIAMSPITLTVLAIVAALLLLFFAFESNFLGIKDTVMGVIDSILDAFDLLIGSFQKILDGDIVGGLVDMFLGGFRLIVEGILAIPKIIVQTVGNIVDSLIGGISRPFTKLLGGIAAVFEGIITLNTGTFDRGMREITEVLQGNYASGGIIPGSGNSGVPIMAHPGEMILNAGQQRNLFNLLAGTGSGSGIVNNNRSSVNNLTINIYSNGFEDSYSMGSYSGNQLVRGLRKQGGMFT